MTKKTILYFVLIAFVVGAVGSVAFNRYLIPTLSNIQGLGWLSSLSYNSPIVITRREEVRLNEGVNLIELTKQAQTITVSIHDAEDQSFLGNGLIITSDGTIFTTRDVLGTRTAVTVVTDNGMAVAGLVRAMDPKSPLAVVSVDGQDMPVAQFFDARNMQTAQRVFALGRTNQEFTREFASGLVTRSLANDPNPDQAKSSEIFNHTITTDADLDVTYLGGPVVNLQGQVVGMVVGSTGQILPTEAIDGAMRSYLQTGKISRPYIGLSYLNLTGNLARLRNAGVEGALVVSTESGSPAAAAGLLANDLIMEVNGQRVGAVPLEQHLASQGLSETRLRVRRGTTDLDLTLRPSAR